MDDVGDQPLVNLDWCFDGDGILGGDSLEDKGLPHRIAPSQIRRRLVGYDRTHDGARTRRWLSMALSP